MKLVSTLVRPGLLQDVRTALDESGAIGMTISEVSGFGHEQGPTEYYRGVARSTEAVPWLQIDVLIEDRESERLIEVITSTTRTENSSAGRLWVTPVETVVRIRTGEHGSDAL